MPTQKWRGVEVKQRLFPRRQSNRLEQTARWFFAFFCRGRSFRGRQSSIYPPRKQFPFSLSLLLRAEPVLTRIKENRKRIISPSFDNIKYDNFEIEEYPLAAQGFDWELWCRYLNPPKAWWKLENSTAPIR